MSLKAKFWIWTATIYFLTGLMAWQLLDVNKGYFIAAEVGLLLSLVVFLWFQKVLLNPVTAISEGLKMLEEQDFNSRLVPVGQREADQLIHVYNRMLDCLREERLHQEETHFFLHKLIDASPQGIIILDFDGNIKKSNPAMASILGMSEEELTGLSLNSLPTAWSNTLAALQRNQRLIIRMDGGRSYRIESATFSDKGFNRPFILVEEQTHEIMVLERQAYEKVIRMMSHEVNNSAGAVNSLLSSLAPFKTYLPHHEQEDYDSALRVSISRNENLSRFMSNLASVVKLPPPHRETMDIHQTIGSVVRLMGQQLKTSNSEVNLLIPQEPLFIEADRVQMEQVLVNIIKNAIEAISQDGIIEISTVQEPASLSIKNNGEPIPESIRLRLFTPFFSTKKHGQGVGLTLIREVLSNHGYPYRLETLDDGFTRFGIEFNPPSPH